jgi:hypothetical protein
VVVEWAGARVLVRADMDKKRIELRVSGEETKCPEALDWVRGHFDEIHENFKHLGAREMLRVPYRPEVLVLLARLARASRKGRPSLEVECGHEDVEIMLARLCRKFFGAAHEVETNTIRMNRGGRK